MFVMASRFSHHPSGNTFLDLHRNFQSRFQVDGVGVAITLGGADGRILTIYLW